MCGARCPPQTTAGASYPQERQDHGNGCVKTKAWEWVAHISPSSLHPSLVPYFPPEGASGLREQKAFTKGITAAVAGEDMKAGLWILCNVFLLCHATS